VIALLFAAAFLVFLPRSQTIEKTEDGVQGGVAAQVANGDADEKNASVPIPSQAATVSNSDALAVDAKNPGTQPAAILIESKSVVLPASVTARLAFVAGVPVYWYQFVGSDGAIIGINTFGLSAPEKDIWPVFGFTVENITHQLKKLMQ
jgi:hypothetical protein